MVKLEEILESQITGEWGTECEDGYGVNILRTTNFTNIGEIDYSKVVKRTISDKKIEVKRLNEGDIILEKSGGSDNIPVGRVVFCDAKIKKSVFLCNNFTQALRVNSNKAVAKYVFYFLMFQHKRGYTELLQNKTTGIRNLQLKHYMKMEIPTPPIEEQKKIAEILDKASNLISLRKQQIDKLNLLVRSRFVEMFARPMDKKFERKTLPDIISDNKNSLKRGPFGGSLKKENFVREGYLVYEQRHAIHNDFEYAKYFITEEKYKEMIIFKVEPHDLLVSCSGVTLGRIAEVPDGAREGIINQALLKITLNQSLMNNTYFIYLFRDEQIQDILFGFSRGSGIPNFPSMNEVKAVKFICPPIELQNQFADFVQQVDKQKLEMQAGLEKLEQNYKALMQQYFG